ncbi:aminotransferase class I/II-fold pyridoxal phosphate-dependent enzyme [Candidatus Nanopelagicales bacterium]|nr:aminotransferase class I/II-fold pyridoxal phosphate-dependent enzyme [Candidatus Nanopelagicales bacterium]
MVATLDSPLTMLQQRLAYAADFPERDWHLVVDNVPPWPPALRPDLSSLIQGDPFQYAPCSGLPELIDAIVMAADRDHDVTVRDKNVLVTNGAMHALGLIADHQQGNGMTAYVQRPVLAAIPKVFMDAGFRVEFFDATPKGIRDLEQLVAQDADNVGLIYLNSPNNPTGQILGADLIHRLARLAQSLTAALIVDQVYDSFGAQGVQVPVALPLAIEFEHVFYVNSMSKNYGSPGLRIGWVVGAESHITTLSGRLERENVAVNSPCQAMAATLLRSGNLPLQQSVLNSRRSILAALNRSELLRCQGTPSDLGGSAVVVQLPVADIEGFANTLLQEHSVAVATPANFAGVDATEQSWLRIPLGYPEAMMTKALDLIEGAVRSGLESSGEQAATDAHR